MRDSSRSKHQGGDSVDEADGGDSDGVGEGWATGRVAIVEEEHRPGTRLKGSGN